MEGQATNAEHVRKCTHPQDGSKHTPNYSSLLKFSLRIVLYTFGFRGTSQALSCS